MRVAIVSAILFLSGCSALIFQTLWLRLSGLAFGNSVWSAALILSSFMAGLGLGSAIAASSQLRRVRPLRLYAALELVVALFGCTIVFGLPLVGEWMRPVFQMLWEHHALLNALRFFVSFLILLVPTTAMGLTLPVLLDDEFLRQHEFGRALGILYGANTLGAVAGALLGEGLLIGAFGLWGTSITAGALNCVAALAAWSLSSLSGRTGATEQTSPRPWGVGYQIPWRLLSVSFGAGAILLALEVVWFRFLRLYVASSPTAFAVMLAVVLAGIGLGGLAAGAIHRRAGRSDQFLPILLLLSAICALVCYVWFPIPALRAGEENFFFESWRDVAMLSLPLMFPGAFLSGMLFPAVVSRVESVVGNRMTSTGITTLFNTAGAAAGPLLATFVFLPHVGFQKTLIICAVGYALLAVLATGPLRWSALRPLTVTLVLGFVVALALFPYRRDEAHFANARREYESAGLQLVRKIEGTSDTYQLLRRDFLGAPYYYRLLTDAFSMSATNPRSQRYMRLFAYLPQVLRPDAEDALLICFGLGQTADALTRDARLKRIDIVDISREVFSLADAYFSGTNPNPLRDARVHAFVQDGRFFLQATPRRYDIITGEPPPPKVAGAVNLYTEQFFALMKSRLKEDGVATFWLPIYQLKVSETKAILRAFHNAFPNASVWASADEEWIMTGINGPGQKLTEEDVRRLWSDAGQRADLARIGVEVPEQIGALFLMDADEIDRATESVPPLTDIYPKRLGDESGDLEETHNFATNYLEAAEATRRFRASKLINHIWPETMKQGVEAAFVVRETRFFSDIHASNGLAELDLYLRRSRLRSPILEVLHTDEFRLAIAEAASHQPAEAEPDLIAGALARRDIPGAIALLERQRTESAPEPNDIFLLTYLYCLNGDVEKAEQLAAANASATPRDWFVDWLWGKLQAEFGFRPPAI